MPFALGARRARIKRRWTGRRGLGYGLGRMSRALPFLFAASALALAGCGSRDTLRPASAEKTPPKPALAAKAPTTEQLLTPPPIARPQRQDEGLSRSEERKDDPFDLPPTRR
jgi:hypothetical protein